MINLLLQLVETLQLVVYRHLAVRRELQRLGRILTIADVRSLDPDRLEDGPERVGSQGRIGKTNTDHGATRTEVVDRLLKGRLVRGDNDGGVWTETLRGVLDLFDEVFGGGKVDKGGGTELEAEVALGGARVDGNDAKAPM